MELVENTGSVPPVEPLQFTIRLEDFDVSLLPIDKSLLAGDRDLLRESIATFFSEYFAKVGGVANILPSADVVSIAWSPSSLQDKDALIEYTVSLLNSGAYGQVEPILKALAERYPDDFAVHYNMGMMQSNQGHLDEAISTLQKAVELSPNKADAWVALGVAQDRKGNKAEAKEAFAAALKAEPHNPHALMSMGGALLPTDPQQALVLIKAATSLQPESQLFAYNYAQCCIALKMASEADAALGRVMELAPFSNLAAKAEDQRRHLANLVMQSRAASGLRPEVVTFCMEAIHAYTRMDDKNRKAVIYEVSLLGKGGFDINASEKKYSLKSMPGKFSSVQLLAYLFVGIKGMNPALDPGIDFQQEYEEAKRRVQDQKNQQH